MNLNAKYDVFVSYSRKDYVDESNKTIADSAVAALLDFLDKNKIQELDYPAQRERHADGNGSTLAAVGGS